MLSPCDTESTKIMRNELETFNNNKNYLRDSYATWGAQKVAIARALEPYLIQP